MNAFSWYEEHQVGLGDRFLESVESCLDLIMQDPERYAVVHQGYRRALVRRFPFAIFFESIEETVTIYSVFHCSRDPKEWRKRLR